MDNISPLIILAEKPVNEFFENTSILNMANIVQYKIEMKKFNFKTKFILQKVLTILVKVRKTIVVGA